MNKTKTYYDPSQQYVLLQNTGEDNIYVGSATITSGEYFILEKEEAYNFCHFILYKSQRVELARKNINNFFFADQQASRREAT